MRRLLIFLATIALGGGVLWYLESRRVDELEAGRVVVEPIVPSTDVDLPLGPGADGGEQREGTPPHGLAEGESVKQAGLFTWDKPRLDDDDVQLRFAAQDSVSLNAYGTALRLMGVTAETYVLTNSIPRRDVLRTSITAEAATLDLQGGDGEILADGAVVEVDLEGVVVKQKRGTPLAELTLEAPRMFAHLVDEQLRSVEKDQVEFSSPDVRGWGRGLLADMQTGRLEFSDGADVTIDVGSNLVARIQTPEGGTLRIVEIEGDPDSDARRVHVIARQGVHATLRDDGTNGDPNRDPITLDAKSLDVWLAFEGDGKRPRILSARADGAVHIDRGLDAYYGDTAVFSFDESGEPSAVNLEDQPRLEYIVREEGGLDQNVVVSGVGPLTAHFLGAGDARRILFDFDGPGRIEAVDRGADIAFERRVHGEGVEERDDVEVSIDGDVRVVAPEGTLVADRLRARQAPDGTLTIQSEDPTRITHRDLDAGVEYRFSAGAGLRGRLTDAGWIVDEADDVHMESLGREPFRVDAGRLEEVDLAARTLRASTDIWYRTVWGTAFAPGALVREGDLVTLEGAGGRPVEFHFTPEDPNLELEAADSIGVRTGWIEAPRVRLAREGLIAEGNVAASIETLDGVFGIDCATLLVDREVTGMPFDSETTPVPAGLVQAPRAELLRIEAQVVREARYDTTDASALFVADRLIAHAPLTEAAAGEASVDAARETRMELLGGVDGRFEIYGPDAGTVEREVVQTATFRAADATIVRGAALDLAEDAAFAEYPLHLLAHEVDRFIFDRPVRGDVGGQHFEVECEELAFDGDLGGQRLSTDGTGDPIDLTGSTLVADGDVKLVYRGGQGEPTMRARAAALVLVDAQRGSLAPEVGGRVRVTGVMPGSTLPYSLVARTLKFDRKRLEATTVNLEFQKSVRGSSGIPLRRVIAPELEATSERVFLRGLPPNEETGSDAKPVRAFNLDARGMESEIQVSEIDFDPSAFDGDEGAQRSIGPREPVAAPQDDRDDEAEDAEQSDAPPIRTQGRLVFKRPEDGLFIQADDTVPVDGVNVWPHLTALLPGGVDFDLYGLVFDLEMIYGPRKGKDYLIRADRGVIRGLDEETQLPFEFKFAAIDMEPQGGEILVTIVAPEIEFANDHARADYIAFWIDRARWNAKLREIFSGEEMPESFPGDEALDAIAKTPNYFADLLFEIQSEKYGRYVRALFMEGNVEIARADRRAARGSRLYIGLDQGVAWLEDAELVYPLMTRGEEVPLRVRTERLETDGTGRLVADGATLTTCDHDEPHFVVRTNEFRLEPRDDGRWRFNASGNRLRFQAGLQIPLPSIGNLVLDEEFGVEGFENEAGEVTPLRDIGIARTARFGTVLGAAFRFDVGKIGSWIGERIGMNTDNIRGKWDTEAKWLQGRGPLLGLGLALRERKPGDDPDEDFRLDAYVTGIPDDGEDRGTVRVPTNERETGRLWGYVRARYPIVRGEWVDVAIASQSDAAVQSEFYEGDYLHFEQRDTFVRWRKALGADYLTGGVQKRIDDYRSQKEELPSFLAYRGERAVGQFGDSPVLWGGNLEVGYFTRREGESFRDLFSDLPGGAILGSGDDETGRADLAQRLSVPIQTRFAGIKATPFLEGRGTAWTQAQADGDDPSRGAIKAGMELSTTLHKVTPDGYLHALAPRISVSDDLWYEESGGVPIALDETEQAIEGQKFEAGLRAIWVRPRTFENLDFDLRAIRLQERGNGLPDATQIGALAQYITRYGDGEGQIGLRHDARYDAESGRTVFTRSSLAWRPNDEFLSEIRYGQALAIDGVDELYENGALVLRARLDPKWEIEGSYVRDLQNDEHLLTEVILRRFSHDFVFDISFQDRTGEGGTTVSFSLLPLLGWSRDQMGMLDRR